MQQTEITCSGIHPNILKYSKRATISPIIAKSINDNHNVLTCWLAFPGCDFEVLVEDDVAVAFRRSDVKAVCAEYVARQSLRAIVSFADWSGFGREDFNAQLLDNMMIALRGVTGKGNIVADSRHFVAVMAKAIEKLEVVTQRLQEGQPDGIADVASMLNDIKLDIFRHLMSKDLRK